MSDQELYDFFKKSSAGANEMPSESLWSKIHDELKSDVVIKKRRLNFAVGLSVLLIALLLILIFFSIFNQSRSEEVRKHKISIPQKVNYQKARNPKNNTRDTLQTFAPTKKTTEIDIKSPSGDTIRTERTAVILPLPTQPITEEKEAVMKETSVPIQTNSYKDRIVIRVSTTLSDTEFDNFIQKMKSQNENTGKLLVIFVKGRATFRQQMLRSTARNTEMNLKEKPFKETVNDSVLENSKMTTIRKPKTLTVTSDPIFSLVDIQPEFEGGTPLLLNYFRENFTFSEKFTGSGKILVSFVVEKDGSLSNIKIKKDFGFGSGTEAMRILKSSPKWLPGLKDGKPVRCQYLLPITVTNL